MDLSRYFSVRKRQPSQNFQESEDSNIKSYLALLASPINEDAREALSSSRSDVEKLTITMSAAGSSSTTMLAGNGRTSSGNIVIYKPHHEASSIELFYDLFFVANLAYFTAMHQHTDAQSLVNYLKLFTLLWFTWLSTTLFDVRFSIDCVWNRLHKAIQFGVFTGFVFAGPVFDKYNNSYDGESYKHFALVLVVSRCCIAIQYAVVMWQGRMFRQTLLPLGLSTAIHIAAAAAYAATLFLLPNGNVGLEEQVVWVVIVILEGLTVLLIAMIWRIVSFKYTHIVERLQLLTLIIIGEGIIGMIKSVACITKGQAKNNSTEFGSVVAAVLLLYLIYMLYFDQFSEDRFGTLRQQIWSLLHYPLHMAIVICVEGNTSLIVWNSAVQAIKFIWTLEPKDYTDPADGFRTPDAYMDFLNQSMLSINERFRSKKWEKAYDWNQNLTAIASYTSAYGFKTDEWNDNTGKLVRSLFTRTRIFVFEAHADTLAKLNAVSPQQTTNQQTAAIQLEAIYDVFNVTVMSFYIGAGAMLLLLAILYWFNKMHKTKYEFGEMINRVVIGFALIILGVATVIGDKSTFGFKFEASHWIIAIVVLCFVAVLFLDNVLLALSRKTSRRNRRRGASWDTSNLSIADTSTVNLLPHHSRSRNTSRSPSRPAPLSRTNTSMNTSPALSQSKTHDELRGRNHGPRATAPGFETRHNIVDFAYQTPSHSRSSSVIRQADITDSLPVPEQTPDRSPHKKEKVGEIGRRYENANWSDEQSSDIEDHLKRLGRAYTS